ncbi:Tyrosine recombinase XerC [Hyphomicrobium sp. ghe19]|nr:Tyrosine recombinase XerC [Hyphomicrobium sp. ghe19]
MVCPIFAKMVPCPANQARLQRDPAACAKAGIEDFHPHDFRHTFGSRLARATKNIKLVQKAIDHSNIKSTLRYVSVQQEEIVEARGRVQTARAPLRLVAAE